MKKLAIIPGLFAFTLLYFSDVLTGHLLLVGRDLTSFFYPFRYIWIETARQGHFPFWNPYIKCGVPLFATIQTGVLYPFSLIYLFLPLDLAFNWTIILHFFLAALFTYALMRELGATFQGSLTAALALLFSGYLISVHNMLNTLLSVSWYPLVILCGCRLVQSGKIRWALASAITLACMFLGGGAEVVLFAVASLLLLCIYPELLPLRIAGNSPNLKRRLGLLGLTLIVFLGLSMVQLLPFLELYPQSHRYGGVDLQEATIWSLAPRDLIYFLLPGYFGKRASPDLYWEMQNYLKTIYLGPVIFLLGGVYFIRQGKRSLPLLAALGLVLLLALGKYTPLYPFLYKHLPLFSNLRYPVKFLFLLVFYLCVVSGLGLDLVAKRFSEKHKVTPWHTGLQVGLIIALTGLLLLAVFFPGPVLDQVQKWSGNTLDTDYLLMALHSFKRLLFIMIVSLILVFFGLRHKLVRFGSPLLLMLLALDLFIGNRGFVQKLDGVSFHATTPMIRTLKADADLFRFHVMPEKRDLSVITGKNYRESHLRRKDALGYDLMMEHHLFDIDGYNVPLQPRYEKIIGLIRGQPLTSIRDLLDMLNVKYVLSGYPTDIPGYTLVRDQGRTSKLYENSNWLPRVFLVKNFQVLEGDQEFARAFIGSDFNPRETVLLESQPFRFLTLKKQPAIPAISPAVRIVKYQKNKIVLAVDTPEAAFLFMSEAYYPGWKAYVDGKDEVILRANYAFRAIPVGPGSHRIEVVCKPWSFKVGSMVSLFTILLLLGCWVISARLKGRGEESRTGHR
ncbi:MAG: YfhO family protein, partial [Deltaproteobacteria bacterium]|nr:YfhO family protein [Deltaproteobacteria bacterium]